MTEYQEAMRAAVMAQFMALPKPLDPHNDDEPIPGSDGMEEE